MTAYTETLLRELTARNVDLLITRRFGSVADKRFDYEFLFADAYSVAAGARNPWVRRHKIELADLVDEPWVLPPPEVCSDRWQRPLFAPVISTIPARP